MTSQVLNARIGRQYAKGAAMRVGAYDTSHMGASRSSKELAGWNPGMGSADADLLGDLPDLVARSRDLARNHGIASGAFQTLIDNVVGTGLRLASIPDYRALGKDKTWARDFRRQVETLWREYSCSTRPDVTDRQTFAGLTALVARQWFENGEALALPLWLPDGESSFATRFQLVEADRLSNPEGKPDSDQLRGGIELNPYGAPVAFHIRKSHPGDLLGFASLDRWKWERVPAKTAFGRKRVIHTFYQERVGQNRGKPVLTAILPQFKMFDHYGRTELQAAVVNALVAAFIKTPMDSSDVAAMVGADRAAYMADTQNYLVPMKGAAVLQLPPGTEMQPFAPGRPAAQFGPFMEVVARHIGAGLNLPYELLLKDWSKTNYSSARAALLEAWRFFRGRRTLLTDTWITPAYQLWFEEQVNAGRFPVTVDEFYATPAAYLRAKWIGPPRGWVDPVKEVQAAKLRMEAGISTLEDECAEQGTDWEEVLEQQAEERETRLELGLPEPGAVPVKPDSNTREEAA